MSATKRQILTAMATINYTEDIAVDDVVVTPEDITTFIENSIAQIDSRNEKAAAKAAEKRAAGDETRAAIKAVLGETPKTIAEIVAEVNNPELTNAKVVARLTQLVNLGEVFKSDAKVDGRTVKAYSTVPVVADDAE